MKIIITESQIRRIVQEISKEFDEGVNLTGTYLDSNKYDYKNKSNLSNLASKTGNLFKDNPKTSSSLLEKINFDFDSQDENNLVYRVDISDKFVKKYLSNSIDEYNKITNILHFTKIYIQHEDTPVKRIHFPLGLPSELNGIGLGYVIYEYFIKFLGWGSSSIDASGSAKNIWKKIANDPDFYIVVIKTDRINSILAIYKYFGFEQNKIYDIITDFINYNKKIYRSDFKINKDTVIIDEELLNDYLSFTQLDKTYFDEDKKIIDSPEVLKNILSNIDYVIRGLQINCDDTNDISDERKKQYLDKIEKLYDEIDIISKEIIRLKPMRYFYELELKLNCYKDKTNSPNFVELKNKMAELMNYIMYYFNYNY
jgi:hypothetical protein